MPNTTWGIANGILALAFGTVATVAAVALRSLASALRARRRIRNTTADIKRNWTTVTRGMALPTRGWGPDPRWTEQQAREDRVRLMARRVNDRMARVAGKD